VWSRAVDVLQTEQINTELFSVSEQQRHHFGVAEKRRDVSHGGSC
jgi:hypothetical protein